MPTCAGCIRPTDCLLPVATVTSGDGFRFQPVWYVWCNVKSAGRKIPILIPGYLVRNIEWAFKVWREQPWGKNISFAQFCEYILPYRVGNEKLEPWREKLYYEFMPAIERHLDDPRIEDPAYAADILLDSLFKSPYRFTGQMGSEVHIGPQIVEWKSGSCLDLCHMAVYVFRALGYSLRRGGTAFAWRQQRGPLLELLCGSSWEDVVVLAVLLAPASR